MSSLKPAHDDPLALPTELYMESGFVLASDRKSCDRGVRRLLLDSAVTVGRGRWAQVYAGRIVSCDADRKFSGRIVLKLVDPKYFSSAINEVDESPEKYTLGLVDREASAYDVLKECPFVPTWHGTYQIILPDGRHLYGHVIEYIEGKLFGLHYLPPDCQEEDEITPWILRAAEALDPPGAAS